MKRVFENIEVACGMPVMQQGDKLIGGSFDIDGEVIKLPLGVFGMIAPFNFPAMVPFWFIPYAIASGNTFVLKTSKQVPMTMQLITQYMEEAGIPDGVFNLVNGDSTVADALMSSPVVKGISLVGSTAGLPHRCREMRQDEQALSGDGWREEPPGRDARREDLGCDPQHDYVVLRVCGPALHGLVRDRRGGRDVR